MTGGIAWGMIGALALSFGMIQPVTAAPAAPSYSIDLTRYFATPEAQRLELESLLTEATAFPSMAPQSPKDLLEYLHAGNLCWGDCNDTERTFCCAHRATWTIGMPRMPAHTPQTPWIGCSIR